LYRLSVDGKIRERLPFGCPSVGPLTLQNRAYSWSILTSRHSPSAGSLAEQPFYFLFSFLFIMITQVHSASMQSNLNKVHFYISYNLPYKMSLFCSPLPSRWSYRGNYLNNESTKSFLLNNCKSPIFSPTPIYFTGILNWSEIPMTTPPFAVPSNFVSASAFTSVACVN